MYFVDDGAAGRADAAGVRARSDQLVFQEQVERIEALDDLPIVNAADREGGLPEQEKQKTALHYDSAGFYHFLTFRFYASTLPYRAICSSSLSPVTVAHGPDRGQQPRGEPFHLAVRPLFSVKPEPFEGVLVEELIGGGFKMHVPVAGHPFIGILYGLERFTVYIFGKVLPQPAQVVLRHTGKEPAVHDVVPVCLFDGRIVVIFPDDPAGGGLDNRPRERWFLFGSTVRSRQCRSCLRCRYGRQVGGGRGVLPGEDDLVQTVDDLARIDRKLLFQLPRHDGKLLLAYGKLVKLGRDLLYFATAIGGLLLYRSHFIVQFPLFLDERTGIAAYFPDMPLLCQEHPHLFPVKPIMRSTAPLSGRLFF